MSSTSLDLSQIKTDALASAASFRTLIGVDLTSYLPLAGGTMTGQIGLDGHAKLGGVSAGVAGIYQADGTTEGQLNSKILCGGTGISEILSTRISYLYGNSNGVVLENGGVSIGPGSSYWFASGNAGVIKDTRFQRVSANVVALKNAGTTPGTLQVASVSNEVGDLLLHSMGYINLYCDGGLRAVTTSTSFRPATINMYDLGEEYYPYKSGYFATSVVTPLVDNPSAALTLGNATYGVSVPGASTFSGSVDIVSGFYAQQTTGSVRRGYFGIAPSVESYLTIQNATLALSFVNAALSQSSIGGTTLNSASGQPLILAIGNSAKMTISSAGDATFSGSVAFPNTEGFILTGTIGQATCLIDSGNSLIFRHTIGHAYFGTLGASSLFLQTNGVNRLTINSAGAATFTGPVVLTAATTSIPSINIPAGAAPTSPADGDMWCVGDILYRRIGGVTKSITFA